MSWFSSRKAVEAERRALREARTQQRDAALAAERGDAPPAAPGVPAAAQRPLPIPRARRGPSVKLPPAVIIIVGAGAMLMAGAALTKRTGGSDPAAAPPERIINVELSALNAQVNTWPRFFACFGLAQTPGVMVATLRRYRESYQNLDFPAPSADAGSTPVSITVMLPTDGADANTTPAESDMRAIINAAGSEVPSPRICGTGEAAPPPPAAEPGNGAGAAEPGNVAAPAPAATANESAPARRRAVDSNGTGR